MNKIGFQTKIYFAVVAGLLVAMITSFFSVNYSVSNYIYNNDSLNITNNSKLVETNIATQIQAKVTLAQNMKIGITNLLDIKKIQENTGFLRINKVLAGMVFGEKGPIEDKAEAQKYFDIADNIKTGVLISDVERIDDKNVLSIAVREQDDTVTIYYVDLSFITTLIENTQAKGSFIELFDAQGSVIYSNKKEGNLIELNSDFSIPGMNWTFKNYIDQDFIKTNTSKINTEISIALIIAALIIIPLSLFSIRFLAQPIVTLRKVTEQLAQGNGDLTHRIAVTSNDDLGKIAANINAFSAQLQQMIHQVNNASEVIGKSAETLNQRSISNTRLIENHILETEMVVTAISEMSSTAESVSESTTTAVTLTKNAESGTHKSREIVNEAVNSVSALAEEVEAMSSAISAMSNNADHIAVVLKVIGDIADQTNLLALNAAIEAARAGEQGRGFSVVADEVRALAARTQASTSEINKMLQELQTGTQSVVSAMGVTRMSCQRSAEKTAEVTHSLDLMSNDISEINAHSIQIATAAAEQYKVAQEVKENMENIQEVIVNINENGNATAQTTKELSNSNTHLSEIVSQFKT